jgi:hypothetical protein
MYLLRAIVRKALHFPRPQTCRYSVNAAWDSCVSEQVHFLREHYPECLKMNGIYEVLKHSHIGRNRGMESKSISLLFQFLWLLEMLCSPFNPSVL